MKVAGTGTRVGAVASGTTGDNGGVRGSINNRFTVTPLTSDVPGAAPHIDPQLKDVWGVASLQDQFWAVAQETGQVIGLLPGGAPSVHIPLTAESLRPRAPDTTATGIAVASESNQILMDIGGNCAAASMLVAAQSGKIWAVNPNISQASAFMLVDRSRVGAQFTGVAIINLPTETTNLSTGTTNLPTGTTNLPTAITKGGSGGGSCSGGGGTPPPGPPFITRVLGVDFHNGRVEMFDVVDGALHRVTTTGSQFVIPNLPANFAPFGILATDDRVVLTAAERRAPRAGEPQFDQQQAGDGLGVVAAFDLTGNLLWRTESDMFNIPWGMAMGDVRLCAASALLVAQHGNPTELGGPNNQFGGAIIAMDIRTGKVVQPLLASDMQPVQVPGLWGLTFATGITTIDETRLHLGAGPETPGRGGQGGTEHGLFARLDMARP